MSEPAPPYDPSFPAFPVDQGDRITSGLDLTAYFAAAALSGAAAHVPPRGRGLAASLSEQLDLERQGYIDDQAEAAVDLAEATLALLRKRHENHA